MESNPLAEYEYLLHHVETEEGGEEVIHHCLTYDHIGNMFEQAHLWIENGKVYLEGVEITEGYFHILARLEPSQEVAWSDTEAEAAGITPKPMVAGMTLEEKARIW